MRTVYSVVTFGSPNVRRASYYRSLDRAKRVARECVGSGTCTTARVHACESVAQAKTADIGSLRRGEHIV